MKALIAAALIFSAPAFAALSATERIQAAEKNIEGRSFQALASMTVNKGDEQRHMKMRLWWQERKYALVKILEPAKDRDTGNLRIGMDLWQYLPKVNRIIRIPSSMMLQSWMGSDFSNDDLVRGGSLASDYTHKSEGPEKIGGEATEKITCTPKPTAPIVWGKVVVWVRASDNAPVKQEYYTEHGDLVRVMTGENIQSFGAHHVPTKVTMRNMKKENSSTVITYDVSTIKFDQDLPASLFTQENLRKGL